MELSYKYRQHQETDLIPGLSYPEAQTVAWMNLGIDQDDSPENGEMVSSTSVERSHAITSRVEETHASMPQAQSCLMHYPSKGFIQIDRRKWNDLPAYGIVEKVDNLDKRNKSGTTSRPC